MDYEAVANKILPNLGHKIKDFQYNTWHFTNWNNAERKLISPEFEVGGCKWCTLFYPFGTTNLSKVSIYLKLINPPEAYSCAQFAFILWNSEEPTQYIKRYSYYRFTAKQSNWGFAYFCDQYELFIPTYSRTRPLIENNSCNITTFVRILEDPTGILWFNNRTSPIRYIGLKNLGENNTFMNSVIQTLYFIQYLRKAVFQIPTKNDKAVTSISSALQQIFCQLNVSDVAIETTELAKFFGWNTIYIDIDIRKFIRILQNDLEVKMKNTKADGTISKLFVGTKKNYIKCINVDYESTRFEDYYDIQLNVKGCITLEESFDNYVQETLEGDNKYEAESYGLQVAKKKVIFESFPPILHIYLNCVLVRKGLNKYFVMLKFEKNWIKFDNAEVTKVSNEEVLECNYICEDSSVYMLLYFRESCVNEILSPVHYKDIPKHLYEAHEQKQKELNYSQVYIQVWIVTEEIFKKHMGFDFINFDNKQYPLTEFHKFEVLKNDTYEDFKKKVSEKFGIPLNKMKFWIITSRSDGTFRPQELIFEDKFFDKQMKEITNDRRLILYMEISDKSINDKKKSIIIFLKYFDPNTQLLEGLGHLYVQKYSTISSIFPVICKKKQLPLNTPLEAYEETKLNKVTKIPGFTFRNFLIHNGDIICFQKTLTNKEINEHLSAGRLYNISQFYESISMSTIVLFRSKFGYKDPIPEFSLVLNKNTTLNTIANQVAVHINIDPLRLRFTPLGRDSFNPNKNIEMVTNRTLSEILPLMMFDNHPIFYYEILDINTGHGFK
ncbi:putative ubiquitin-specific processing protease 21 [Gigaspora margarita]|uniref:Putative ubiquitin-specific processing protease 21 n=1 Tax=Gigaspora margarita TaxID=4874 RepID=A0A8H3XIQ2_GIGMA|nr:putative ubiquitin-specific processing protease 21 [Gigaspora margarita]